MIPRVRPQAQESMTLTEYPREGKSPEIHFLLKGLHKAT